MRAGFRPASARATACIAGGVAEAIRIGRILEEYNHDFYEAPVPWDWHEEQKQVERALDTPVAGGEEEFGLHAFRYPIGNEVFQILQPDLFYIGGMIRTACSRGKACVRLEDPIG